MSSLIGYFATVVMCILAVRWHSYGLAVAWGACALGFMRDSIVAEIKKLATPRGGE